MHKTTTLQRGEPFIWVGGAALALILLTVILLLGVVLANGAGAFWPSRLTLLELKDGSRVLGEVTRRQAATPHSAERLQIRVGNRDLYGADFRWIETKEIKTESFPPAAVWVERMEYGPFIGFVKAEQKSGAASALVLADASGREKTLAPAQVVRICRPNAMSVPAKLGFYLAKLWELLSGQPREANTEGGLLPAIIGTVMMVFLMSIFAFPLGVMTAVYLREYAKDGWVVRGVRIAVNNLAGIPSIVYGIFGLGFFVYGVGAGIDRLFFADKLPSPTWGTGGILWASLTLSLLTVPVVIVATEEALGAIPPGVRQASLALGATPLQTLTRVLLPMASPGIMTGFILAMARAAGEVAPLMLTGVVKMAPSLPLDGSFPFVHLDRKFMHLGFHIYDVGFQSPNVEAARPMVFMTTLLLLVIVLVMSGAAVWLRNRMRKRYAGGAF
jgi:phosphate transport system permease protein